MGQSKRVKKEKKPKPVATREQRQALATEIRQYLALNDLPEKGLWPVEELLRTVDSYVESGISASGKISVPEAERTIVYMLSSRPDPREPHKARGEVGILYTGSRKEEK